MASKKIMPIGITDYKKASENCYVVDKTQYIQELLDSKDEVTLITRPRRFGKTFLMSMLDYFFALDRKKDSEHLFDGLAIDKAGSAYMSQRGSRPVIFMSLKNVDGSNWDEMYASYCLILQILFKRCSYVLEKNIPKEDRDFYFSILHRTASVSDCRLGLYNLSLILHNAYGARPILLLDEYDAPLQHAWNLGFYEEAIKFFRGCFNAAFKDNDALDFAVITGVLRVAKESIFSGLNNLKVRSLTHEQYAGACGFTEAEIERMMHELGLESKMNELREWYDGYHIGGTDIYNPWSVLNYISDGCKPSPYWINTSSNGILRQLLAGADRQRLNEMSGLLDGKTVRTVLRDGMIYDNIGKNKYDLYNMLLTTGYLTMQKGKEARDGEVIHLAIPNREIRSVYASEIIASLTPGLGSDEMSMMLEDMLCGNGAAFADELQNVIKAMASNFDTAENKQEIFYHGFMLGITAMLNNGGYQVRSEGESGYGRFDVAIFPLAAEKCGVIMEFKACKDRKGLQKAADEARRQIDAREYITEFKERGIADVWKYGISFAGKYVCVAQ